MNPATPALPLRANDDQLLLDPSWDDAVIQQRVVAFYHERFQQHDPAQQFLRRRGLDDAQMIEHFQIGFADRALARALPDAQLAAGRLIRSRLQNLGLYRSSGHGHHNGCLVVPVWDETGQLLELYGRKIAAGAHRQWNGRHIYLSEAWRQQQPNRGVWNAPALAATEEVILCDSVLNALTFWCAGLRHVTCSWGLEGFTDQHLQTLQGCSIRRVLIAYRRTEQADQAAGELTARLSRHGIDAYRVEFPRGLDANAYAARCDSVPEALAALLKGAAPLRRLGGPPDLAEQQPSVHETVPPHPATSHETPTDEHHQPPCPNANAASDSPPWDDTHAHAAAECTTEPSLHEDPTALTLTFDDRRYRIRGLQTNHRLGRLKVNLSAFRDGCSHRDILDLCAARSRASFIKQAAAELYVDEDRIKQDVGHVLDRLETLQDQQMAQQLKATEQRPVQLTPEQQHQARQWLGAPGLLQRIAEDYDGCGLVGEQTNKLICYLACVSRWLPRPLAVLIQSSSAAGKTSLMDATLALMPPEQQVRYSALTEQSLYYMGGGQLKHQILAIAEEEGVAQASYALKLLQSDGRLRIASPGKDTQTGRHQTQDYEVEGPVMMFLTTTSESPDAELQSRCLTLRVDEQAPQTEAIHAAQRRAYTLEGQVAAAHRQDIRQLHQNAQRLLRPLDVVIPWAEQLTFRTDQIRMRRHHEKYLSLIAAVTLLHQYQRPHREYGVQGQARIYIESTLQDIAWAHRLANEALGDSLQSLMPQTRQLLVLMDDYVQRRASQEGRSRAEIRVKQRELREHFGWSDFQLRKHLGRLVDLEYVLVYRTGRGNERQYELLYQGEGRDGRPFVLGLADISTLGRPRYDEADPRYECEPSG